MFKIRIDTAMYKGVRRVLTANYSSQRIIESKISRHVERIQMPIIDFMWKDMCMWKDKPFMTCAVTGETLKFGEARELIHDFARYFVGTLKLQKGEVLALVSPVSPLMTVVMQAALEAGLVVSGVNPAYTKGEMLRQLQGSNATALIAEPTVLSNFDKSELGNIRVVLPLNDYLRREAITSSRYQPVTLPRIEGDDLAVLFYSSGTTGLPKGVKLSNTNCTTNLQMWADQCFKFTRLTTNDVQDITFSILPMNHCFGFNVAFFPSIYYGQHYLSIPKFTPEYYLQALRKYRPNGLMLVPPVIHMMLNHPAVQKDDLSSIDFVITGGSACPPQNMDALQEKAGRTIDIRSGYGMTELSAVAVFNPRDVPRKKREKATVGLVLPGTRMRIVDTATGRDLGPGEQGELLFKGPHIMQGYLNNEKATKETIDPEGWLHTGDIGYYDEDDFVYITDRTKDLIKVKSLQVAPTELENIILEIPEVLDAAVIGVPDDRSGELPLAFIVPKRGEKIDPQKVISFVNERVSRHKQLAAGVRIIDQIPKNPTGKILRRELRKLVTPE